jgi:hypothetical protein
MNIKAIEVWKIAKNTSEKCIYSTEYIFVLSLFHVTASLLIKTCSSNWMTASTKWSQTYRRCALIAMAPRPLYGFCHCYCWSLLFRTQNRTGVLWGSWSYLADSHMKSFICCCKFPRQNCWSRDDDLVLCVSIFVAIHFIFLFIFQFRCYEPKYIFVKRDWRYTTLAPTDVQVDVPGRCETQFLVGRATWCKIFFVVCVMIAVKL